MEADNHSGPVQKIDTAVCHFAREIERIPAFGFCDVLRVREVIRFGGMAFIGPTEFYYRAKEMEPTP